MPDHPVLVFLILVAAVVVRLWLQAQTREYFHGPIGGRWKKPYRELPGAAVKVSTHRGFRYSMEPLGEGDAVLLHLERGRRPAHREAAPAAPVVFIVPRRRPLEEDGFALGDPALDQRFNFGGDEAALRALLTHPGRGALLDEIEGLHALVLGPRIQLRFPAEPPQAELEYALDGLIRVAEQLQIERAAIPRQLARIARGDPRPAVREGALGALIRQHPRSPEALARLEEALGARDPALRLLAIRRILTGSTDAAQRRTATGTLRTLLLDSAVPEVQRRAALPLLDEVSREQADALHERLLWTRSEPLRMAALERLTARPVARTQERLRSLLRTAAPEGVVERACLRALVALGAAGGIEESAAPTLAAHAVRLLGRDSGATRLASVQLLAEIGDLRAVEPLLPLTRGLLGDRALRQAARVAVEAIRDRAGGQAASGQLSVVDGGHLSVTRQSGKMSVLPDQREG